jgi:hypothetical protein
VLPAISAIASLGAAVLAPPLVALISVSISLALLVLGQVVWRLLDDG